MEDLYCAICHEEYNTRKKLPRLFPNCGHTFCSSCIQDLIDQAEESLVCPEDQVECQFFNKTIGIGCFPLNFALHRMLTQKSGKKVTPAMERIEKIEKPKKENELASLSYCNDHSKVCDLICMTDKKIICTDCVLFGMHKNHQYLKMDDFKKEVKSKLVTLESKTEILRFKSFLNNSDKELDALKQKVNDKKRKLLTVIKDYANAIIEEVKMKEKELEEDLEARFTKFDYALSIIDNTAKKLIERQTNIDRTVTKIKNQIRKRDFDYIFLMNSLYSDNSVFTTIKELLDELSQLEINTTDVIDKELEKYAIEGDIGKVVTAVQVCMEIKCNDLNADECENDKQSQHLDDDIDKKTNILTPNTNNFKNSITELKDRGSSILISPNNALKQSQLMSSRNNSLVPKSKTNNEFNKSEINPKDESVSLIDVHIDEIGSELFNIKSSKFNTPHDRSSSMIKNSSLLSNGQGLKKNPSFFRKDMLTKPFVIQNSTNFAPDSRDKLHFNNSQSYHDHNFGAMGDNHMKVEIDKSLYNKTCISDNMLNIRGRFVSTQTADRQPSWTEGTNTQELNKLPRTSIRQSILVNRLNPISNRQTIGESEIEVDLSRTNISDNTLPKIINGLLRNKKMKALNLSHNSITEIGFEQILKKLANHPSLERIYLMNNYLDDSVFLKLEQWSKKLKKINYFNLQNCAHFKNIAKIKKYVNGLLRYGIKVDV